MLQQLQVYEVDHPATQRFKLHRLSELKWEIPSQLHFVTADLTKEKLAEAIKRTPYDTTNLSFFNWQGVTYYLSHDEVLSTLSNIADISPAGSLVVFDYLEIDALDSGKAAPRIQGMIYGAKQMNEPIKTGFDPSTLDMELNKIGLHLREDLSPSEIQSRYFRERTDKYYALEQLHIACAEVK